MLVPCVVIRTLPPSEFASHKTATDVTVLHDVSFEVRQGSVVALVGRPNVGKSTLFNRYAGYRRALVADQPGLTRDRIAERIVVEGRAIWVVDTAGLDPVQGEADLDHAIQEQARAARHSWCC